MKDTIAKQKGPASSLSRSWQRAYKHNTVKARRQNGLLACLDFDPPEVAVRQAAISRPARIVFQTQYRENYGAHYWNGKGACPQYWKNKGGQEYCVEINLSDFCQDTASKLREIVQKVCSKVNYSDNFNEEWVIDWNILSGGEMSYEEKDCIQYGGLPYSKLLMI